MVRKRSGLSLKERIFTITAAWTQWSGMQNSVSVPLNAHTDPLFKKHKILKVSDLIQLNQSIFVRQFKNGKLPESFIGFFRDIPFNDRKSRDDDYNLQRQSNIELLHFPSCQIIRSWNQNHLSLKSEADFATLKEDFIQKKLNSYDEECFKPNCKACRQSQKNPCLMVALPPGKFLRVRKVFARIWEIHN